MKECQNKEHVTVDSSSLSLSGVSVLTDRDSIWSVCRENRPALCRREGGRFRGNCTDLGTRSGQTVLSKNSRLKNNELFLALFLLGNSLSNEL